MKRAMSIAGSDSGGGAGIEADLKTFSSLGVWGTVAITSVTAQNTLGVTSRYDLPPEEVRKQIEAIIEDIGVDAFKSGMLGNSGIIREVKKAISGIDAPYVLDPVMVAKSGDRLLDEEAISDLKDLISEATLVTPNVPEAEVLTGEKIEDLEGMKRASKEIVRDLGAEGCILKGGHLQGDPQDVLFWRGKIYVIPGERREGGTHGTGCTFSAAITSFLAKGLGVLEAVRRAKEFVEEAISRGPKLGRGNPPVDPSSEVYEMSERWKAISSLEEALSSLLSMGKLLRRYLPEVGSNFVYSLPREIAKGKEDVAGVMGRIVKYGEGIKEVGPVKFGASDHLARAILKYSEKFPEVRSVMNLKYSEEVLAKAKSLGMRISSYDRRLEPKEIKEREGGTVSWGIWEAIKDLEEPPDLIYHLGDWGKEAMILIFGRDPFEVLKKLSSILYS